MATLTRKEEVLVLLSRVHGTCLFQEANKLLYALCQAFLSKLLYVVTMEVVSSQCYYGLAYNYGNYHKFTWDIAECRLRMNKLV